MISWQPKPPRDLACPACGTAGLKAFVLGADTSGNNSNGLDLFACPACQSKFFPDLKPPAYGDFPDVDCYLKFYLETGAGIDQLVRHVFAVSLKRNAHYLEIGTGFGFALDFARRALGVQVLGIDPSPFAAKGARLLDVPIISDYLTSETDLGDRRFDLVVASEVVEHVFDPRAFIGVIAERLAQDGVLILTTPNAASAVEGTSPGNLIPLLSVGWHYILYSESSLRQLLSDAGFGRIEIAVREHTLVVAATNGEAEINLNAEVDRKIFRSYLEARRRTALNNEWLAQGLGYRLLKELTNASFYERALEVYEQLRQEFMLHYGFDVEIPDTLGLDDHVDEPFHVFAARYPMCLCGVSQLRGVIALNYEERHDDAAKYFSLSTRYGVLLRRGLNSIGSDDAETELLTAQSRILNLRASAYSSPEEASSGGLRLLQDMRSRSECYPGELRDAIGVFVHLVNLGALDAAEALGSELENSGCDVGSSGDSPADFEFGVQRAFGLLEINKRHRPRKAALHFALAERAAKRWLIERGAQAALESMWRARHDRLLAWVVAGNASRALRVAQVFESDTFSREAPEEVLWGARRLIAQASQSIAPVTGQ